MRELRKGPLWLYAHMGNPREWELHVTVGRVSVYFGVELFQYAPSESSQGRADAPGSQGSSQ